MEGQQEVRCSSRACGSKLVQGVLFLLLCFTFYTIAESYLPYANKNAVWLLFIAKDLNIQVSDHETD